MPQRFSALETIITDDQRTRLCGCSPFNKVGLEQKLMIALVLLTISVIDNSPPGDETNGATQSRTDGELVRSAGIWASRSMASFG